MKTLYNGEFKFRSYPGRTVSECHLLVVQNEAKTVVVMTELAHNPGMSVTNASERLATQVVKQFNLNVEQTTFVEHYGVISGHSQRDPEEFSVVTYTWDSEAHHAQWEHRSTEKVLQLLGMPVVTLHDYQQAMKQGLRFLATLPETLQNLNRWTSKRVIETVKLSSTKPTIVGVFVWGTSRLSPEAVLAYINDLDTSLADINVYALAQEYLEVLGLHTGIQALEAQV